MKPSLGQGILDMASTFERVSVPFYSIEECSINDHSLIGMSRFLLGLLEDLHPVGSGVTVWVAGQDDFPFLDGHQNFTWMRTNGQAWDSILKKNYEYSRRIS